MYPRDYHTSPVRGTGLGTVTPENNGGIKAQTSLFQPGDIPNEVIATFGIVRLPRIMRSDARVC